MKIAIIGANGRLGTKVTRQALDRGHQVMAILYAGDTPDPRATLLYKSLFELNREDLKDVDVVISAFGGGFDADPSINKEAFMKYIELVSGTTLPIIAIGGAGSLFTDASHQTYVYETPGHPDFLRGISMNIKLGIDAIKAATDVRWTVVCPSQKFDEAGPLTGDYLIGTDNELIFNEAGNSIVSYEDLACAMLDITENGSYRNMSVTVLTKKMV